MIYFPIYGEVPSNGGVSILQLRVYKRDTHITVLKWYTVISLLSTEKIRLLLYFEDVKADFSMNLRAELDFLGITVKELSARTRIPKRTLDCYFGVRASVPPADVATKIAATLGVTVEFLVTGQDVKKQGRPPDNRQFDIRLFDKDIRSIIQILGDLSEKDVETMLGLARVLKKQSEKNSPIASDP